MLKPEILLSFAFIWKCDIKYLHPDLKVQSLIILYYRDMTHISTLAVVSPYWLGYIRRLASNQFLHQCHWILQRYMSHSAALRHVSKNELLRQEEPNSADVHLTRCIKWQCHKTALQQFFFFKFAWIFKYLTFYIHSCKITVGLIWHL